jgi:phosphate starvation-inducible protein PhoH and related proteins
METKSEHSVSLNFENNSILPILYGEKNKNFGIIERILGVTISSRGNYLAITGSSDNVKITSALLEALYHQIENGLEKIDEKDIAAMIDQINSNSSNLKSPGVTSSELVIKTRRRNIFPYNKAQQRYLHALDEKDVTFGIGVAGTGKTYLAVAMAVGMFLEKRVNKIILTRPAVEAGEKLGFLPGDLKEKVDPYLQPLYDALYDMLPVENIERYFATKELQIAPLAFMRGRTLNNAFVILDEAQNTTIPQMKMFLTRLGHGSRMAITGDLTQIDLPTGTKSGLIDAIDKLKALKEIAIMRFESTDAVRHPLTQKIIDAYEQY